MLKKLLSPNGLWENGFAVVRIVTGMFMIFHGWQIFAAEDMKGFVAWMTDIHFPLPGLMPYVGKSAELLGGVCLILGLFTRIATIFLAVNFTLIAFIMGHGRIFTEDQHPFLFVLLSLIFLFIGPGPWSLDRKLFGKESPN